MYVYVLCDMRQRHNMVKLKQIVSQSQTSQISLYWKCHVSNCYINMWAHTFACKNNVLSNRTEWMIRKAHTIHQIMLFAAPELNKQKFHSFVEHSEALRVICVCLCCFSWINKIVAHASKPPIFRRVIAHTVLACDTKSP